MRKGLVLEGGAMRGLFTAGVLDVFMENGIDFDGVIGVSAGAAFGCNFKSRQIGRALRYNVDYCRDKRYCSIHSLVKTGDMFGADFCYRQLPKTLDPFDDDTYNNNPVEFHVVATDINSGGAIYCNCPVSDDNTLDMIRASASMPLVSNIVNIGDFSLLDGGIADSVPIRYFESIGYDKNVIVLTQPDGYVKKPNKAMPLLRLKYKKYPAMLNTMALRHEQYNETLEYIRKREAEGAVLVIRPERPLAVGRIEHDPEVLKEVHQAGRLAALMQLDKIKEFLK